MSGFVDGSGTPARRSRNQRPAPIMVDTVKVFTAAALAHRINQGEYVKAGAMVPDPENGPYAAKPHPKTPNRVLMEKVLDGSMETTAEDGHLAQSIMTHYKGLTMRLLAGKLLNEFDQKSLQLASSEQMNLRDIAVVAALPSCYVRAEKRKSVEDRVAECEREHLGTVGDKITVSGEVVRCSYSQQWGTHYITMITQDNHAVFFGNKRALNVGQVVRIQGNVRAHRDGFQTQLNYVRVI